MKETISSEASSDSAEGKVRNTQVTETETEKEGETKKTRTTATTEAEDSVLARSDVKTNEKGGIKDASGLKSKMTKIANKVSKVSGLASGAVNIYCGAMDIVGSITAIVAAYQALQVIKVAASIFEGIQKAQAGDTDGAPLNEIANSLMKPTETTYREVKEVKKIDDEHYEEDESKTKVTTR
jgi:hypothetical protein